MKEKIIETKQCKNCSVEFHITDKDLEFLDKISPIFDGKKYDIPTPTLCGDCKQQRNLALRNERNLYRRNCDHGGRSLISIYSPDSKYVVYNHKVWWGDDWNPLDYGQDFILNKPFFQQFDELLQRVPRTSLLNTKTENTEYGNDIEDTNNSYLVFNGAESENLYYTHAFLSVKDCVDCDWIIANCQLCYDSYKLENCYKCFFCYFCSDSTDCILCYDCHGSKDCIGCVNLYNKQYCVFNEQLTEKQYKKYKSKLDLSDYEQMAELKKKFLEFKKKNIHCSNRLKNCENCTGDNLLNSSDSVNCFHGFDLVGCKNAWNSGGNYIYDSYNAGNTGDLLYENVANYRVHTCAFVANSWDCKNIFYSDSCYYSEHLFGCVGLRNKKYCILNMQYSKEEYEKLVPRIIERMKENGEWGEFFPANISPFGYNESVANEYFPLTEKEAKAKGYKWLDKEYPINVPGGMPQIEAKDLPNIKDLTPELEKKLICSAIICEKSKKPYRLIKQEIEFYKKHNLPLPRKHQDIRHEERIAFRNPMKLFDRKCDKCEKDIQTTYPPERKELVYCEGCYRETL